MYEDKEQAERWALIKPRADHATSGGASDILMLKVGVHDAQSDS